MAKSMEAKVKAWVHKKDSEQYESKNENVNAKKMMLYSMKAKLMGENTEKNTCKP